jgi:hypothetical protein
VPVQPAHIATFKGHSVVGLDMQPPCYGYCRAVLTASSLTMSNGTVI